MFGFPQFGKKQAPVTVPAAALDAGRLVLISQEDIYRHDQRRQPILLLRKGQEIAAHDLPKLIQNGVRPDQVSFQYAENGTPFQLPISDISTAPVSKPEVSLSTASFSKDHAPVTPPPAIKTAIPSMGRRQQDVLVLESNPKQMKRLIDCLFLCGFDLNRIHPLRISSHLSWALRRHQPDMLIADYEQLIEENIKGELSAENCPPHIILTMDTKNLPTAAHRLQWPGSEEQIVQTLLNPASRFAMKRLLTTESTTLTRPLMIS